MKCVIAGGSGFLGNALSKRLTADGHDVVVLTRGAGRSDGPVRSVTWPAVDDPGPWREEINGAGAVINLAGAGLADKRWTTNRKEELHASRILATRALVSAIRDATVRPPLFLSGSAMGFYGGTPGGGPEFDESGPPGSDFLATLVVDWEAEAHAAEALDCRVVLIRTGLVLSRDGGALQKLIAPFKYYVGGPLGSGLQVMSWIHLNDWVSLMSWLVQHPSATGAYNGTAPHPVTNAELSKALGAALGRPSWLRVPGFVLKILVGEMAGVALLAGQRVIPRRALDAGFSFEYPDITGAMQAAVGLR
ncbi:MAG TPA: TIGR01777 family oxidoreductase [Vicinamibacterales bacterium]|nr:TIGR01777 family oxidoreductase [Vicinamibacterales bacterium]